MYGFLRLVFFHTCLYLLSLPAAEIWFLPAENRLPTLSYFYDCTTLAKGWAHFHRSNQSLDNATTTPLTACPSSIINIQPLFVPTKHSTTRQLLVGWGVRSVCLFGRLFGLSHERIHAGGLHVKLLVWGSVNQSALHITPTALRVAVPCALAAASSYHGRLLQ
jgi:hypothetical protein